MNKLKSALRSTASIALGLGAICGIANAQTATDSDAEEARRLDTIKVTSQFREQSVLEVPLAVTAYDGAFLEDIGVDEFDELSAFVPGFVVQEQSVNNPGFVLRGITSDDGASTIEPRVSVFQNGVSISRSRGSVVPLYDLERVEVLNGPQGTLFGRSAQIGAVHIISNKAQYDFSAEAAAEFGNFNHQKLDGHVNLPIIDNVLAGRLSGYYESRDGYVDNNTGVDLNSVDTTAVRGSLRFDPTEALRLDLIANYVENSPTGTSFKSGVIPALGGTTSPFEFASLNTFGNFLGGDELSVDRNLFDITLIAEHQINDAWSITSTTAYREFESLEIFDPDGTALDLLIFGEDAEAEQISTDVRFSFDNGSRFTGFFGGGYFAEEGSQAVPLGFDLSGLSLFSTFGAIPDPATQGADVTLPSFVSQQTLGALLTGDPTVFTPSGLTQTEFVTNFADNTSFDLFGEATFEAIDNLELTAGLRYTSDDKETGWQAEVPDPNGTLLFLVGQSSPLPVQSVLGGVSDGRLSSDDQAGLENEFDGFSWRLVANYEFRPDAFVYFNYSRGRRPEVIEEDFGRDSRDADGDGIIGDAVGEFVVVPDETVDSFEVGLKGIFLEDRLTVQAAAYYYDYENFQTSVAVNEEGSAPEFDLINAGSASSKGIETSFIYSVSEAVDVFATYGWNESRFDDEDSAGNPQQFAGNQFRLAPDHALSIGLDAEFDLADGVTAFVRPTYTWQSEVFFTNDNDQAFNVVDENGATIFTVPAVSQDSYGLLNLNAGVDFNDGRYGIEVYGKNLLDEEYIIDGGNTGGVFKIPTFIQGAPQFYGLRLKARY